MYGSLVALLPLFVGFLSREFLAAAQSSFSPYNYTLSGSQNIGNGFTDCVDTACGEDDTELELTCVYNSIRGMPIADVRFRVRISSGSAAGYTRLLVFGFELLDIVIL
ncbi:hypothetical protein NEOLEDRAFT_1145876 [Neolentinus lepideus HHB14362 ss-1]|uniref:Uncharacterized protein n=1 Tax=Neolentinus lepideus HHB14362 ss-1 TaxID=1314782 RepID=A0A165UJ87_9AGAM|nr:hypothetical protein NEOLEDRAFT_1145876 [Neolentinus lepideus HHB14362 ss-1]